MSRQDWERGRVTPSHQHVPEASVLASLLRQPEGCKVRRKQSLGLFPSRASPTGSVGNITTPPAACTHSAPATRKQKVCRAPFGFSACRMALLQAAPSAFLCRPALPCCVTFFTSALSCGLQMVSRVNEDRFRNCSTGSRLLQPRRDNRRGLLAIRPEDIKPLQYFPYVSATRCMIRMFSSGASLGVWSPVDSINPPPSAASSTAFLQASSTS